MRNHRIFLCLFILFVIAAPKSAFAKCVLSGDFDLIRNKFDLELNFKGEERISLNFSALEIDKFKLIAKLDHFKLFNSFISTDLTCSGKIVRNQDGSWKSLTGEISTDYSLLNFKPSDEIDGSFEITKTKIQFNSLEWGNLKITGSINVDKPHELNLLVDVRDTDISQLTSLLGMDLKGMFISGLVNGQVSIEGTIADPRMSGKFRANDGNIDTLKYTEILVNVEGIYPILKFIDSNVFDKDGYVYSLSGKFNAQKLDNFNSPEHEVSLTPITDSDFTWDTWKIKRKKFYGQNESLELEYKLKDNRPFKMRLREDEEILSLEHSVKF